MTTTNETIRNNPRWNQQLEARYQTLQDHTLLLEFLDKAGPNKPSTLDPLDPKMEDFGTNELLDLLENVSPSQSAISRAREMCDQA